MKILVLTHANKDYEEEGINNAWEYYPYYFSKLGAKVKIIHKREWYNYLKIFKRFKPNIVISIGRITGLITAIHKKLHLGRTMFIHDLTDHPYFYKSGKRIKFIVKNHDITTTSSMYNLKKFNCNFLVPNGSNHKPIQLHNKEIKWDACYLGQVHSFYKIDQLIKNCKTNNIKLKIINNIKTKEVPYYIARSKICVYPISWDSSTKIVDYAAMSKPIVAVKPNLAENIKLPAYYCKDLAKGIHYLLENTRIARKLGKESRKWFLNFTDNWINLSKKYLNYLEKEYSKRNKRIFTMDVEKDIDAAIEFAKILSKNKQIGEFYICGYLVEKYPKKVKRIEKLGHIIGGHGYYHEDFAKLSYTKAEKIIKKTIEIFRKNKIRIQGWRFPGLSFRNSQLKIISKYNLYDSSIKSIQIKKWGKLIFLRNWIKNIIKGNFTNPIKFTNKLIEKSWDYADLYEKDITNLKKKQGRLIFHCYKFDEFK